MADKGNAGSAGYLQRSGFRENPTIFHLHWQLSTWQLMVVKKNLWKKQKNLKKYTLSQVVSGPPKNISCPVMITSGIWLCGFCVEFLTRNICGFCKMNWLYLWLRSNYGCVYNIIAIYTLGLWATCDEFLYNSFRYMLFKVTQYQTILKLDEDCIAVLTHEQSCSDLIVLIRNCNSFTPG